MSNDSLQVTIAVLATVWLAVLASVGPSSGVGDPTVQLQTPAEGADPTVQFTFERRTITPSNATSFVLYVGNPADSERPTYVMVLLRVHVDDGDLPVVVDAERGLQVGDTLVWQYNFDLQPGEYRLKYGTVGRNADPGEYDVEVNATYWEEQEFASQARTDRLFVRSPPDGDCSPIECPWEFIVGLIALVVDYPEAVVAVAAVLGLLISIIEGDRTWPVVRRIWRWTRVQLDRITRWAFRDERR